MTENFKDAILPILKNIQEDISSFRKSVEARFDAHDERFERLEVLGRKQRRDAAGVLVMMRATAGDFDERVTEVEARVAALERRKS